MNRCTPFALVLLLGAHASRCPYSGGSDKADSTEDADGDGWSADGGDCDDEDPGISPNATDIVGDRIDQNCDGIDGTDQDGDGFAAIYSGGDDCNDDNASYYPGATEGCDGSDYDCDGLMDSDRDEDGYPDVACGGSDCNDASEGSHPGVEEVCDLNDNDCDGEVDEGMDDDDDGFLPCVDDCDDANADINPAAEEVCDDHDNDCDGWSNEDVVSFWCRDYDGDGYGNPESTMSGCSAPGGYVDDCTDCNDHGINDSLSYPGADEILDDGVDNDCDGVIDEVD